MKKSKEEAMVSSKDSVSCNQLEKFDKQYDEFIKNTYDENPLPETTGKRRGRKKKGKVLNLDVHSTNILYAQWSQLLVRTTEEGDSVKEYLWMRDDHKLALKKIKQHRERIPAELKPTGWVCPKQVTDI